MTPRFRLEAVRRVREARRDELRGRLADAYRAAELLEGERRQVARELALLGGARRRIAARDAFSVAHALDAQRYELALRAQGEALAEKARLVAAETERRREAVTEAERDVRALDLLEERRRREHEARERRAEVKALDEVALTAVVRRSLDVEGAGAP